MSLNQRATAELSTLYTKCSSSPLTYPSKHTVHVDTFRVADDLELTEHSSCETLFSLTYAQISELTVSRHNRQDPAIRGYK
jgi:hypothetical protein